MAFCSFPNLVLCVCVCVYFPLYSENEATLLVNVPLLVPGCRHLGFYGVSGPSRPLAHVRAMRVMHHTHVSFVWDVLCVIDGTIGLAENEVRVRPS